MHTIFLVPSAVRNLTGEAIDGGLIRMSWNAPSTVDRVITAYILQYNRVKYSLCNKTSLGAAKVSFCVYVRIIIIGY